MFVFLSFIGQKIARLTIFILFVVYFWHFVKIFLEIWFSLNCSFTPFVKSHQVSFYITRYIIVLVINYKSN